MNHISFHGPDTPTTAQQIQSLHADLGIEHVNVFKMKQPPLGAHPKVLRAYYMFRTLPDMWHEQFSALLDDETTLGLVGSRGMPFDADAFDAFLAQMKDSNALTLELRDATNPTIDRAIMRFGSRCRAALNPEAGSESGVPERHRDADELFAGLVTNPGTLARMGESRWGMEPAARQGFRAARDAEWRLQGVIPETATLGYDRYLNPEQAAALSGEGIAGTLSALADCHEQVFLAIRAILRRTEDHTPNVPFDWSKFMIADRGDGKLTLDISPEVFDRVRQNPPETDDPWTGCPAIPFIRQYHLWSSFVAKRFYLPHLPRLQTEARKRQIAMPFPKYHAEPVRKELKV